MVEFHPVARMVVFTAFCAAALIALAAWLVRSRRVSPFGAVARGLRAVSEPVLRPIERRLVRSGGNPAAAGWWLVVGVAIAGVLLLSLLDWLVDVVHLVAGAFAGGPRATLILAVVFVYRVLVIALIVRIIGSWIGA